MNATSTEKLQDIFRAVFKLAPGVDATGVRPTNQASWDSLAHVLLVAAIESEFGVTLDAGDALRMTSFQATQLVLEEKSV